MTDLLNIIANAKTIHIVQSYKGNLNYSADLNMDEYEISENPNGYELTSDAGDYYAIKQLNMEYQEEEYEDGYYDDYIFKDHDLETRVMIAR